MNNESADETITPEKPVQLNEEDLQKQEVSFSSRQYIIIVILIVLFFLALVSIIMDYMIPGLIFFLAHSIGFVIFYYNDQCHLVNINIPNFGGFLIMRCHHFFVPKTKKDLTK